MATRSKWLFRFATFLTLVPATCSLSQAEPSFQLNHEYNIRWGSNLFPNGYTDIRGQIVPPPTAPGQPPAKSGAFRTGVFGLEFENPPYQPFAAVCIDANEPIFTSGTHLYYVQSLASFPSFGPYTDGPTPSITAERRRLLQQLYTVAWSQIGGVADGIDSAAFQFAVWEIARENTSPLNVVTGGVKITGAIAGQSTMNAVVARANQFLSWIDPLHTPETALAIWSPVQKLADGTYVRITGQELLTVSPVPEPQFYGLLATGVGFLLYRRSRARSQASGQER